MYDLEVADAHEFVAAGVIVHNCQLVHHLKPAVARQRIESDERLYRNARPLRVYEGATEVLLDALARRLVKGSR